MYSYLSAHKIYYVKNDMDIYQSDSTEENGFLASTTKKYC